VPPPHVPPPARDNAVDASHHRRCHRREATWVTSFPRFSSRVWDKVAPSSWRRHWRSACDHHRERLCAVNGACRRWCQGSRTVPFIVSSPARDELGYRVAPSHITLVTPRLGPLLSKTPTRRRRWFYLTHFTVFRFQFVLGYDDEFGCFATSVVMNDGVGGRWRWWWVILMMERCESVVLSVWVLVLGFCSLWFLCRWRMKMIMEGLRGGEFVEWIKGNNGLWCFSWWRCSFSSCWEHNEKKPPVEEGEGPSEWRDLRWYLLCLCSVPFSPWDVG